MSKPVIVGDDPRTSDRAPIDFAVAATRFTGAPLVIASVCSGATPDRSDAGRLEEDLPVDASDALDEVRRELGADSIAVDYRELESTSAARALHEAAEAQDARLLVVGSTHRGPMDERFRVPRPSA
jgi:nucleotide-binding universal stress UspA family protein